MSEHKHQGGGQTRALVSAYFERLNNEDWAGLIALFSPEAELRAPGGGPWRGREAIRKYYESALTPYPYHHDEPVRVIPHEAGATVEIHFTGRMEGGIELEFEAIDLFDIVGGEIVTLSSWYDSAQVRRDLEKAQKQLDAAGG